MSLHGVDGCAAVAANNLNLASKVTKQTILLRKQNKSEESDWWKWTEADRWQRIYKNQGMIEAHDKDIEAQFTTHPALSV